MYHITHHYKLNLECILIEFKKNKITEIDVSPEILVQLSSAISLNDLAVKKCFSLEILVQLSSAVSLKDLAVR